ncbi:MAG: hypothetical protein WBW94_02715 [Anaerolineales bacterium]
MRFFKASLRTLIMLASTFSFLGGWILLAHSLKPTSTSSSSSTYTNMPSIALTPFPTLAPIPGFDSQQPQTLQPVQQQNPFNIVAQQQPQFQTVPMFTTSGS